MKRCEIENWSLIYVKSVRLRIPRNEREIVFVRKFLYLLDSVIMIDFLPIIISVSDYTVEDDWRVDLKFRKILGSWG